MEKILIRVLFIVGLILLVPLFGNFFISGWNWSVGDFVAMGILLFCLVFSIDLSVRTIQNRTKKVFVIITIISIFLLIWIELAVGAVSKMMNLILF